MRSNGAAPSLRDVRSKKRFPEVPGLGEACQIPEVPAFLNPLGLLGFNSPNIAQRHALHVERTAEKAVMLSDRV